MSDDANQPPERRWGPLNSRERRVLGVLVEKQKTTPDAYPMSVAALVTGSNQKSNRDPVTFFDANDVEQILLSLRKKGAVFQVEGSGRVEKWRHNLYEWLDLKGRGEALAVMAELLLRGTQTVGELRGRASRMDPIDDLDELQTHLDLLIEKGLVVVLTPREQKRGVVVTHALMAPEDLDRERQKVAHAAREEDGPRVVRAAPGAASAAQAGEVEALRAEVEALKGTVEQLSAVVRRLSESLGE